MIGMIAACDLSGLIGYDNQLPFKNSRDLKRFKSITMNSTLIMGRKTWESLPKRTLKGRIIHVLHKTLKNWEQTEDVKHFYLSFADAITSAKTENIWICGGAQIYKEAIMSNIPEVIDLTIHNYVCLPPPEDSLQVSKQKSVYLPEITYFYEVESEKANKEDPQLIHRKYIIRNPEKWATDWKKFKKLIEENRST